MTNSKLTQALPTSNINREQQESKRRGRSNWSNHGCSIYAYPSDGSIIVKSDADMIDMAFLGFDRMTPSKECFQDERENMFAKLLLKAGGTRWSSIAHWKYSMIVPAAPTFEERVVRVYGWPGISTHPDSPYQNSNDVESGAWIIEDTWQARFDTDDESYLDDDPVVLGKLRMALNMEEKIEVMKELGAKFYPDPREFPGLRNAYDPDWPSNGDKT